MVPDLFCNCMSWSCLYQYICAPGLKGWPVSPESWVENAMMNCCIASEWLMFTWYRDCTVLTILPAAALTLIGPTPMCCTEGMKQRWTLANGSFLCVSILPPGGETDICTYDWDLAHILQRQKYYQIKSVLFFLNQSSCWICQAATHSHVLVGINSLCCSVGLQNRLQADVTPHGKCGII